MGNTEKMLKLFRSELVTINVGPRIFADALDKQNLEVLQVEFRPDAAPAQTDPEMLDILDLLGF